jgi:hypothetical protein
MRSDNKFLFNIIGIELNNFYFLRFCRKRNHKDRDSHYTETHHIKLTNIYKFRFRKRLLNEYGLEEKDVYRTADVCQLLGIRTFTFLYRLNRGIYLDGYERDGVGRIFTIEDMLKFRDSLVL